MSGGRVALAMGIQSSSFDEYESFSEFESLQEFNRHMEMWLLKHKDNFSKGELIGLKLLVRFAAKIPGVCHAKIGTVLKAIHEEYHDNGISRSTFKRMVGKGKELGIFMVYETERKNGSQSSNLYVFQRFASSGPPEEEILNRPIETSNLSETEKEIKKRKEETPPLDSTFVSDRVPRPFVELVRCILREARVIEEYWRMVQITAFGYELGEERDVILGIAIDSFKQLVRKLKLTNEVRKPIAYFYGILREKFYEYYSGRLDEMR
jgi:hypothetical protein